MPNESQPKISTEGYPLRLKAGLYIVTLVMIAATLVSLFSKSQSKESIFGLFAMALTVVLIVVFLVIRQQPETPSSKWFHMDNPSIAVIASLLVNIIWYLLIHFISVPTPP